jgi:hypothetical protein
MKAEPDGVLIPPGVANPDVLERTFKTDAGAGQGKCPPASGGVAIRKTGSRLQVTVFKEELLKQPSGWVFEQLAELESAGCVAPAYSEKLAEAIATSVPMPPAQAFRLLHSNELEIVPRMTVQVVSPIVKDPTAKGPLIEETKVEGNNTSINLTLKASDNLLGVEIAQYSVTARPLGGVTITPIAAERHVGSDVDRRPQPMTNYFDFPSDAAYLRVFYEATQTNYAAIIVAARTRADLEERSRRMALGQASCATLNHDLCREVPKEVAINGMVTVTVNGSPKLLTWGANLGTVMRAAGIRDTSALLPKLSVSRPYNGKSVPVEFDPSSPAILGLVMTGGEHISWK